jgi:hypothetical protein
MYIHFVLKPIGRLTVPVYAGKRSTTEVLQKWLRRDNINLPASKGGQ